MSRCEAVIWNAPGLCRRQRASWEQGLPLPVAETQVVVGKGCGAPVGKGCELSSSCGRGELRAGGSPTPHPGLLR